MYSQINAIKLYYKVQKGKENTMIDVLSRLPLVEMRTLTLSVVKTYLLKISMPNWISDPKVCVKTQHLDKKIKYPRYTLLHGQLRI